MSASIIAERAGWPKRPATTEKSVPRHATLRLRLGHRRTDWPRQTVADRRIWRALRRLTWAVTGQGIDPTVDELRDIALEAGRRGSFPRSTSRVTQDIAAGIRDTRFENGERMERLIGAFAGHYIGARTGQMPVPRCWQATWDVAGDPGLLIVQHLLLGANAHVNHDLAQAVVEVAPSSGLAASVDDFHTVNDVLAGSFAGVIRDLDRVSLDQGGGGARRRAPVPLLAAGGPVAGLGHRRTP